MLANVGLFFTTRPWAGLGGTRVGRGGGALSDNGLLDLHPTPCPFLYAIHHSNTSHPIYLPDTIAPTEQDSTLTLSLSLCSHILWRSLTWPVWYGLVWTGRADITQSRRFAPFFYYFFLLTPLDLVALKSLISCTLINNEIRPPSRHLYSETICVVVAF